MYSAIQLMSDSAAGLMIAPLMVRTLPPPPPPPSPPSPPPPPPSPPEYTLTYPDLRASAGRTLSGANPAAGAGKDASAAMCGRFHESLGGEHFRWVGDWVDWACVGEWVGEWVSGRVSE